MRVLKTVFGIEHPSLLGYERGLIRAQVRLALVATLLAVFSPGWSKLAFVPIAVWEGADALALWARRRWNLYQRWRRFAKPPPGVPREGTE